MARTPKRYSAGSIMLQVVPTLRGIEEAVDEGARRIKDGNVKAQREAAEEGAKEQVKAHKKAAKEVSKVDEATAADRQRWAREATEREQKAARDYVGFWTKALDERETAETKAAEARAKAEKKLAGDRAAAEKKLADDKAKADADERKRILNNWNLRKKVLDDQFAGQRKLTEQERKDRDAALKQEQANILTGWNLRRKVLQEQFDADKKASDARIAAGKKENDAWLAAQKKQDAARTAALKKQAAVEDAFRRSQDRRSVAAQRQVVGFTGDHDALARGLQNALRDKSFEIEVRPDGNVFEREMADIMARMSALRDMEIDVDIDAKQFNIEMAALQARLAGLDGQDVDVQVKADAAVAIGQLAATQVAMQGVQREALKTRAATEQSGAGAGTAANSFRAMNVVLLAAVAIGPVLIPLLASIGGLLVGIAAGAIGVGLAVGAMVFGLMGIGTAIQAMSKADQEARQRAAQQGFEAAQPRRSTRYSDMRTERSRALALRNARERLADTRADAPAAVDNALRRQESAERALMETQERARRAQQDLNDARRQATRDLEDLNLQIRGAALDEQQAVYDMQRAGIRYNAVLEDDQATARERDEARIAYEQAKLQHEEMIVNNKRLREEAAKANAAGVEGSEQVVAAKEAIADAEQATIDAQADVVDAEREVANVRIEQAERIADAERDLTELIEDQRLARLAAAESAAVAAAATEKFSSANFELAEAMNDLSPAGQRFATWLYGLKPFLDEMKFTVQETFLPGLQTALQQIVDVYGPGFLEFLGEMGTALGDGAIKIADWLTGPEMAGFFATLAEYGPQWFGQFLDIVMGFSEGAFLIFEQLAPFATLLGDAIVGLANAFAEWAASKEGQQLIADFVGYLIDSGPEIWGLFTSFVQALVAAMIALAPYSDQLVAFLTSFFTFIADMDTDQLGTILTMIIGMTIAFQVFFTIMAVVGTISMAGFAGLVAVVVVALAGLIGFIAYNWPKIKAWFTALYEEYIKPVVDKIGAAWQWLLDNVLTPVWEGIRLGLEWLGSWLLVAYNLWVIYVGMLGGIWNNFYATYLEPVINDIKAAFEALGRWWEETAAPIWADAMAVLGAVWNELVELAKKPIRFLIETVMNRGVIDTFNNFADNFPGTIEIPHITVPSWLQPAEYATGTSNVVLPGYTPGRDVHQFYSPTGGRIDLSGGEGILRPEVVRALGPDWVERVNGAARTNGSLGVMRHLGAYANGGVLGSIGDAIGGAAGALSSVVGTVMEFVRDPKEALEVAVKALLGGQDTSTSFGSLLLSIPTAVIKAATDYVKSIFTPDVIAKSELSPVGSGAGTNFNLKGWANPSFGPITSRWGPRSMFGNSFHAGTDIAGGGPVYAAAAGKVLHAGLVNPFVAPGRSGSVVQIRHGDGTVTWYGHMLPKNMLVKAGDTVGSGDRIGLQGALGRVTGVHLHYETHRGQDKGNGINPESFMTARGVNLGKGVVATGAGGGGRAPLLYDNGGYLQPGLNVVMNATGKPEPVLTDEQWRALSGGAGGSSMERSPFYGAHFHSYTPKDIVDAYEEDRRRELVLSGADEVALP